MILRPTQTGQYKLVGAGYCHGFMNGEAFMGPLPSSSEIVQNYYDETESWQTAFLDRATGALHIEDPRLGSLPNSWRRSSQLNAHTWPRFVNNETRESMEFDPRLYPEHLEERGIKLQTFYII
jgi:hypothetical protein